MLTWNRVTYSFIPPLLISLKLDLDVFPTCYQLAGCFHKHDPTFNCNNAIYSMFRFKRTQFEFQKITFKNFIE